MPFIGKDWRDPGDIWKRGNGGWKLQKKNSDRESEQGKNVIDNNRHQSERGLNSVYSEGQDQQPHINYVKGTARTRKVDLSLSESLIQLKMSAGARDSAKFLYIYKVIRHLFSNTWDRMSGTAQQIVFNILETLVIIAIEHEVHIKTMKELMPVIVKSLTECRHIYPAVLWNQHSQSVNRMIVDLDNFKYKERKEDAELKLTDLPKECLYKILSLFSNHQDLVHLGTTNSFFCNLTEDQSLWKELCRFHFGPKQLFDYLPSEFEDGDVDWTDTYKMAIKKYGPKEVYTDNLVICRNCRILYWKCVGHPCRSDEKATFEYLSPKDFLELFHL